MTNASPQIFNILESVYGVGVIYASPETILWAASRCDDPKSNLAKANKVRTVLGRPHVYAPRGHGAY